MKRTIRYALYTATLTAGVPTGRAPTSFMPTTSGINMKYGWPSITASASMQIGRAHV